MTFRTILVAVLAAALLVPATAQAHVTLQPNTAPADQFTRLDVRVPNERDDVPTTKIELQVPDGFASISYEPVPGWSVDVESGPLANPIQTDDGEITEGVKQITWTADSEQDGIPPGAFQDFGLSFRVPGKPGDKLEFKALQTYAGGEVVRWIGGEGSDNPAAIVTVVEPSGSDAASHAPTPEATAAAASEDDGSGNGLAIVALIVGALGLVVGAAGLLSARRSGVAA
ncbi:MAG TPA: YcnI family protein [Solirubrobacter sp.]|jgi:uncharacterized protein YcnI|nr:YcnI family protein [Solirubrobacter sp.]